MTQHVASSPCRAKAITHTPGSFFLELRQDYIALCMACGYTKSTETRKSKASPHCKALILSVLEHWTDCKPEGEPIFMALSQWIDSLYGMYCRNVIIDSLEELTGEGLITREGYKTQGGEMYGYHLCVSEINKRLTGLQINQLKSKPKRLKSKPLQAESGELVNSKRLKSKHFIDTNIDSNTISSTDIHSVAPATNEKTEDFSAEEEAHSDEVQEAAAHPIATKAPPAPSEDDVPPPSQKARRARGSLKPRASKKTISPEMQARINAVFDCFDEVAQEVTGDPAFRHARHQTSTQHIRDLLEGRTITREMLKDVYQELWNRPAGTNGFRWRDHMSIKAVCNNFDVTWLAIEATRAKKAKRQMPPDNVLPFPKPEEASSPRILTRSEREAILHPQGRVGAR